MDDPGDSSLPVGARVMFTGPYGVFEDGTYREWTAVRGEDLCLIPDNIDDATAGGMPVAYLTAQMTLMQAGFAPGKTVLAPAIGGAVGNAVTQLARAQGAGQAISTTTNPAKAAQARALGFEHVIDLAAESLADGVARITGGRGEVADEYLATAVAQDTFTQWLEQNAQALHGMSVVVGRGRSIVEQPDRVYAVLTLPPEPRTFRLVIGWRNHRRGGGGNNK